MGPLRFTICSHCFPYCITPAPERQSRPLGKKYFVNHFMLSFLSFLPYNRDSLFPHPSFLKNGEIEYETPSQSAAYCRGPALPHPLLRPGPRHSPVRRGSGASHPADRGIPHPGAQHNKQLLSVLGVFSAFLQKALKLGLCIAKFTALLPSGHRTKTAQRSAKGIQRGTGNGTHPSVRAQRLQALRQLPGKARPCRKPFQRKRKGAKPCLFLGAVQQKRCLLCAELQFAFYALQKA